MRTRILVMAACIMTAGAAIVAPLRADESASGSGGAGAPADAAGSGGEIATATTQINFQGLLQNGGVPVNGTVAVIAKLYNAPSGGTALWTETQPSVVVTDGVFTVALGSVTPLNPSDFTGAPLYLSVAVNGGAELPRTRLLATPFALHSANADHALTADSALDGVWSAGPGSDIYRLSGSVGIGTTTPQEKLDIANGDLRVSSGSDLGPTISSGIINLQNLAGTAGLMADQNEIQTAGDRLYINNDNQNNTIVNNLLHVTTGGGVGIGTDTPDSKLAIENITGLDGVNLLSMSEDENAEFAFVSGFSGAGATGNALRLNTFWGNNAMTWRGDGNVGIGTTSPGARLTTISTVASGLSNVALYAESTTSNGVAAHIKSAGSDATQVLTQTGSGDILRAFNGGGSPVMRVLNSGEVVTPVLQITGGSDLVESFEGAGCPCEPGTVMALSPDREGALTPSKSAYDHRVAGVVSGAGGVRPGIHMGQEGVLDGDLPVAIAGRVYVRASAVNGSIRPGDLLTTSDRPGVAMKATDHSRSTGAILGKAISSLETGDGLVLTLVNLQ